MVSESPRIVYKRCLKGHAWDWRGISNTFCFPLEFSTGISAVLQGNIIVIHIFCHDLRSTSGLSSTIMHRYTPNRGLSNTMNVAFQAPLRGLSSTEPWVFKHLPHRLNAIGSKRIALRYILCVSYFLIADDSRFPTCAVRICATLGAWAYYEKQ